jgi:hypothetical protein
MAFLVKLQRCDERKRANGEHNAGIRLAVQSVTRGLCPCRAPDELVKTYFGRTL